MEAHGAAQGHRYGAEMPSVLTFAIEALFRNGTGVISKTSSDE